MFQPVRSLGDIDAVVSLAKVIWPEHYSAIIGLEQVNYMLASIHSEAKIQAEIEAEQSEYFLIQSGDKNLGYIGLQLREKDVFLSKLYLLSSARGLGLGHKAMDFVKQLALENTLPLVSLTVNKHNTNAIEAYYKMGFVKTGEICSDIGQGYYMDDFQLSLTIDRNEF